MAGDFGTWCNYQTTGDTGPTAGHSSSSPLVSLSNHGSGCEKERWEKTGVNKVLHLTAILLRYIADSELNRYTLFKSQIISS